MEGGKQMKVLGVIGSPRKGENTAALVERVLEGARESGAETEVVYLGQIDLNPCQACESCKKTGRCVQRDGMQDVYDKIAGSRALVLGSPVYFDQVSAQAKMFIDRLFCYCYTHEGAVNFPSDYKAVVAITYEDAHPTRYDYVLDWMKERLEHYHRIDVTAALKASATRSQPASENDALLAHAFQEGRFLGEHVKAL